MIGIFIGIGAILLGMKGFTVEGLPLTKKRRLTGTTAKVVGGVCLLLGVLFIADSAYAIYSVTKPHS